MTLHEKIKMLRKKKKISQQELANRMGIHITYLSRLENGHFKPSLDVIKKFVEVFEVTYDYLINDDLDHYEVKIQDKSLAERMQLVDSLADDDRHALRQIIDTMLTKKRMLDLLTKQKPIINV